MDSNNKNYISDEDLVIQCISGKEYAWEIFYERFFRLVISKVYRIKKTYTYNFTEEDIEECIQQVWVSFLEKDCDKLRRWGKGCKLSNWISVCTGNAVINFFNSIIRKHLPQNELDENISSLPIHSTKTPLDSVIEEEKLKKIEEFFENLPNRERLFVTLYWEEGLSYIETSKIMGIAKENLYLIRHNIIKKIKEIDY